MGSDDAIVAAYMGRPPKVACSYCGLPAKLETGATLYPHRRDDVKLAAKKFWTCRPCGAWVGCHPGSSTALGTLANNTLRKRRMAVHRVFDPIWKTKIMSRSAAYAWLSQELGLRKSQTHISLFDLGSCADALKVCEKFWQERSPALGQD